jgi:hypothetical protein
MKWRESDGIRGHSHLIRWPSQVPTKSPRASNWRIAKLVCGIAGLRADMLRVLACRLDVLMCRSLDMLAGPARPQNLHSRRCVSAHKISVAADGFLLIFPLSTSSPPMDRCSRVTVDGRPRFLVRPWGYIVRGGAHKCDMGAWQTRNPPCALRQTTRETGPSAAGTPVPMLALPSLRGVHPHFVLKPGMGMNQSQCLPVSLSVSCSCPNLFPTSARYPNPLATAVLVLLRQ